MRWKKFNLQGEGRWIGLGFQEHTELFNRDKTTAGLDPDRKVLNAGQVPDRNNAKVIPWEGMERSTFMRGHKAWRVSLRR